MQFKKKKKRKIRVLYIIDHLIGFAGTEKHLLQLVSFLDKDRFCCDVIAFNEPPMIEDNPRLYNNYLRLIARFNAQGVEIKTLPVRRIYSLFSLMQFYKLVRLIRKIRPDIVQTFHFKADTFGIVASTIAGVRNIVSSRRDVGDFKKKRQILLNRICNHFVKKFIAVCEAVARKIEKIEKIPANKIQVIHNGINVDEYPSGEDINCKIRRDLEISSSAFVVGMACIFRPEKGIELFFEGVAKLKHRIENMKVILVGDGPIREEVVAIVQREALSKDVIFTGYARDVRKYIPAMDVACLTPIKNEGLSNVILEEMAMGKPVIATNVGGNAELIADGVTGKIIPFDETDELSKAIFDLYIDPLGRKSMGMKARKRARDYFQLQDMVKRTEAIYLSLIYNKA